MGPLCTLQRADIEVPNRIVAMDARMRSACYPRGSFYPLSPERDQAHRGITKTVFRPCSTCSSCSQAGFMPLHDEARFPSALSQPLYASVTFLEATSPVKLPTKQCFIAGFLCGIMIRVDIFKERCSIDGMHRMVRPSLLRSTVKNTFPVSSCSKAPRGLFVHVCVGRIFTAISISPGNGSRQLSSRSTFRAGRNLPDKELRYHRLIVLFLFSFYTRE